MRIILALGIALTVCGCQQAVPVPTTDDLMKNPQLLAEWQAKCESGEFRKLTADKKDGLCFTTREAARSVAMKKLISQ